jgi:hypothetical protein
MNSDDSQVKSMNPVLAKEEMEATKKIVASLLLARKNYSLYPEGHSICVNSLNHTHSQLDAYLHKYKDLRLEIQRDQLLSQGEIIYSGPPEEGTLPFILFRDGVRWLQFTEGIEPDELREIIKIINKYSIISDESEGDIVTAFWETQLPHVDYEVVDFSWEAEQEVDLMPCSDMDVEDEKPASLRESNLADWEPLADPPIDKSSIAITNEEQIMIQEMVRAEEEADPTEYLDALFDSLLGHREKENFESILEVLSEEFKSSLARRSFDISLKILKNLQYVSHTCVSEIPWTRQFIEDFLLAVSSPRYLASLQEVWQDIETGQINTVKQLLMLLQPEAIHTLADILLQDQSLKLRAMLEEVITALASRDHRMLGSLLKSPDERLVQILIHVLVGLRGEQSLKDLMKLVRHPSEHVRQEALKGLIQRVPVHTREIFKLIDDKDEYIRSMILKQIGRSRDHVVEGLLLDYLEHSEFKKADYERVIACFVALGQCGSTRSIPFLKQTLLHWGWMPGFWRSAHRKGAAMALTILGMNESMQVLKDAGRCFYPTVRRIVRKVKKELSQQKEG